jgi:REP element-mobilizing transposase RayT
MKKDIEIIASELCEQRNVEIIEMNSFSGSIHLLVYLPPKMSTSDFMIFLTSESTKFIFQIYSNPKYLDGKSIFWGKSYFATMVEKDKKSKFLNIRD